MTDIPEKKTEVKEKPAAAQEEMSRVDASAKDPQYKAEHKEAK